MKRLNAITDVPGIKVGHASDFKALTGCTVILCEEGAIGAVDIRGPATGTREIDALTHLHLVDKIHAILLAGGSAFGLDAAGGVMAFLEEKGKGFDVAKTKVPIVPSAIIFDFGIGDFRIRPDREMGYQACLNASKKVEEGSVGVGTGATVGKLFGIERAMKGGVGTASIQGPNGIVVGGLVVVNAFGDVLDPASNQILAGARKSKESSELANSSEWMKKGVTRGQFGKVLPSESTSFNTTLGVMATNAYLTKKEINQVAQIAHSGLVKMISPLHTTFDGDLIFAISYGKKKGDVNTIGLLGEVVLAESVKRAITQAKGFGAIPAYQDIPTLKRKQ
ncbi:MAG TPA: P1 family peptidase [Thermodesulfobacteriota bacterium]|nr:P1 family peptidase [Thermodesulfobacteriota bacterium]